MASSHLECRPSYTTFEAVENNMEQTFSINTDVFVNSNTESNTPNST